MIKYFSIPVLCCLILTSSACKKSSSSDGPPAVVPSVRVEDASQARIATDGNMHFRVSLNKTTTVPVSVSYSFQDGTAKSPANYTANTGKLTIPAGQANGDITVPIKGDPQDTRETNLQFTITLSNPENCSLSRNSATGTIITENGTYLVTDNTGYSTTNTYAGYNLVWSDEFSGSTLDAGSWNAEIGNGTGGWGNNELEYYTNNSKNLLLSNGNLIIEARKEATSGFDYSSARITTQNKKSFTFGRVDIRAKLPVTKGIWPALWMLGANINSVGWPACGEIDIMELIGTYPSRVYATLHWKNASNNHDSKGNSYDLSSGNFSQQFHVYSLIWEQDQVKCLIDDQLYLTVTKADLGSANYPFNSPHFFIFNVAVGGNWPGSPDASSSFPQRMFVDYIRVFQKP